MRDRGRKTLGVQPGGDPFGDMNRPVSPAGTPEGDRDIRFAPGSVAGKTQQQQRFAPSHRIGVTSIVINIDAYDSVATRDVAEVLYQLRVDMTKAVTTQTVIRRKADG